MLPVFIFLHDSKGASKPVNASQIETIGDSGELRFIVMSSGSTVSGIAETQHQIVGLIRQQAIQLAADVREYFDAMDGKG